MDNIKKIYSEEAKIRSSWKTAICPIRYSDTWLEAAQATERGLWPASLPPGRLPDLPRPQGTKDPVSAPRLCLIAETLQTSFPPTS